MALLWPGLVTLDGARSAAVEHADDDRRYNRPLIVTHIKHVTMVKIIVVTETTMPVTHRRELRYIKIETYSDILRKKEDKIVNGN